MYWISSCTCGCLGGTRSNDCVGPLGPTGQTFPIHSRRSTFVQNSTGPPEPSLGRNCATLRANHFPTLGLHFFIWTIMDWTGCPSRLMWLANNSRQCTGQEVLLGSWAPRILCIRDQQTTAQGQILPLTCFCTTWGSGCFLYLLDIKKRIRE